MELEIYWLQFAENKLFDIYNYYCKRANVKVARNLINGIIDATIDLEKHPKKDKLKLLLNPEYKRSDI